jgi:hypothetical protein
MKKVFGMWFLSGILTAILTKVNLSKVIIKISHIDQPRFPKKMSTDLFFLFLFLLSEILGGLYVM